MSMLILGMLLLSTLNSESASIPTLRFKPGYVYKIRCEGRLLISSIGNESLIQAAPLPKEIGCGMILKPIAPKGSTNLLIETSIGTIQRLIEVDPNTPSPTEKEFILTSEGGSK